MRKFEHGSSLVEVLLVVAALGVMVALMSNLPNAMTLINKAKHLGLAREIATKQIEDMREIQFTNLVNGDMAVADSRIALLPGGSGVINTADCDSQICTNSENVKQITITVNWSENGKPQQVKLKTFIGEGGLNQPDE